MPETSVPISIPFTLIPDHDQVAARARGARAYLLPGHDPAMWLSLLAILRAPLEKAQIALIPSSLNSRQPAAALAILPAAPGTAGIDPSDIPPTVRPYVVLNDCLLIPADARLYPPATGSELAQWLVYPLQVFHPSIGLIGLGEADLLRGIDLVEPPAPRPGSWMQAIAGIAPSPRITAIVPADPPTLEDVIKAAREDIGSEPAKDLPPLANESIARRVAAKTGMGFLSALEWLARKLPGGGKSSRKAAASSAQGSAGAAGGGFVQRVRRWAQSKMDSLRRGLEDARNKEIARLLKMLETDPDLALKYALPLYNSPTRGMAPPGANLSPRNVNFDLGSLGRTGPGDTWEIDNRYQVELAARYRAAANRELALGRHRRAAYIFAQLLGDFSAAASTLRQGRYFREAATLYADRLDNIPLAAECLEAGGLLSEAIPLFQKLGRHEKSGDLYTMMDQTDLARIAYELAVATAQRAGDLLTVARLQEQKLDDHQAALASLESGWPLTSQAAACIGAAFDLRARRGLHDGATERLLALRRERPGFNLCAPLVEVLGKVTRNYPEPGVRVLAADAARVVAGARLSPARGDAAKEPHFDPPTAGEIRLLMNHLAQLAPEDRLLPRDTVRYTATPTPVRPALTKPPPQAASQKRKQSTPTLIRAFLLGGDVEWMSVAARASRFYALGKRGSNLVALHGQWDGTIETLAHVPPVKAERYELVAPAGRGTMVWAVPLGRIHKNEHLIQYVAMGAELPPTMFDYGLLAPPPCHGKAIDEKGISFTLSDSLEGPFLTLYAHDSADDVLSSYTLSYPTEPSVESAGPFARSDDDPFRVAARAGMVFLLLWQHLRFGQPDNLIQVDLPRNGRALVVSNPHVRTRVVITHDEGATLFWPDSRALVPIAHGIGQPVACFTREGTLIVVGRHAGVAYRAGGSSTARDEVTLLSRFEQPADAPLAITPADNPGTFAVFYPNGTVRVMHLPPD